MVFGSNFCPAGWLAADGSQQSIATYGVLYQLLGTTYGGNGVNTFQLPDLRGRSAVGAGAGAPGVASKNLGDAGGAETVTLQAYQLPRHTHSLPASTLPATHATPAAGRVLATAQNGGAYASAGTDTGTGTGTGVNLQHSLAAGQQPFSVRSPYLAMQWCIATIGIYPSQN